MGRHGKEEETRKSWSNSVEFLLSLLGNVVGPGNLLRFPYLTLRNGGGAFLIPYFICLFVSGIPLVMIEIYMGQSTRKSCIALWDNFAPILKGTGYSMIFVGMTWTFLYQSVMAWSIYYICASFTWTLPWTSCNETWNTENCVLTTGSENNATLPSNNASYYGNVTALSSLNVSSDLNATISRVSAAEEYFLHNVLQISDRIEDIGIPNWKLCIAHLAGALIIYLCLIKGIRSVGKVVWVSATLPYVFILVFLIRAVLLPGSAEGIKFYLTPDLDTLLKPEPWILGFLQIFYTLTIGCGGIQTMSSYNDRNKNFLYEVFLVPIVTCITSFLAGFVVFSCMGFLAYKSDVPIEKAMSTGPGLAFVSYPEVVAHLPGAPIWSICFFLMILFLSLDSLFVSTEAAVSGLVDEFNLSKRQRQIVLATVSLANALLGLVLYTNSGMYIFQLCDWYFSALALFLIGSLELLTVMWIYGYQKFSNDFYSMIGIRPFKWIVLPLLGIILPTLLLIAMFWGISQLSRPVYGNYEFPEWSEKLGWSLAVVMALPIFVCPIIQLFSRRKSNMRDTLRALLRPERVPNEDYEMQNYQEC